MKKSSFQKEKQWFINQQKSGKFLLILIGILSTVWFLIRVIPKPSRASYPCMKLAAPFATSFIIYLTAFVSSIYIFKKIRSEFRNAGFLKLSGLLLILLFSMSIWMVQPFKNIKASSKITGRIDSPNTPIGEARGIYPGRVVWVWDPQSTNENCTNQEGDYWWQDENTDKAVVDNMLSNAIQKLSGNTSDSASWDALFRYYNVKNGFGNSGYMPGEKIVIKVNICSGGWGNVNINTYEKIAWKGMIDTSPHLMLSILDQLINVVGVAQSDIYIGDPIRMFFDHYWDICHSVYPDVNYLDLYGLLGRTKVEKTPQPVLFYSDLTQSDSLPTAFIESKYMINMSCLKQHESAGITFCAKNHFGSCCRDMAMHLHYSLPSPTVGGFENLGYGKYRNLVDFMEHKDIGEKTFLFMVDGLWGGEYAVCDPEKWQMHPYNNDWPSSIFVSQDHVAIESVGADFVMTEYNEYSTMLGSDDYLHQAADSANWPDDITYDPDGDGILIASMGTHEHWNNNIDKQYSRDLGIGDGIELIKHLITSTEELHTTDISGIGSEVFPNPFKGNGKLRFLLSQQAHVNVLFYTLNGKMIGSKDAGICSKGNNEILLTSSDFNSGKDQMILYQILVESENGSIMESGKIILSQE